MQGNDLQNMDKCHLERSREVRLFLSFVIGCARTERKTL
ncbi:hypothetical protein GGE08_002539 [Muricauda sp. ARW1Y1]|jgi:hypothetical protein|nr:hypothetical protein [Muricauda sp. ARW1Y1]